MKRRWVLICGALVACGSPMRGETGTRAEEVRSPKADGDSGLAHARELLARFPIFDGHNDLPWEIRVNADAPRDVAAYDLYGPVPGHTNLPQLAEGGVGGQFWSVYVPGERPDSGYARLQLEQIDIARRMIDRYPELVLVGTAAEAESAMARGRIASMLGVEGGHAIENSLGALRVYYELGARYMTLTHNVTLDWADAAEDAARHDGLSAFGEIVVREMNRLGMLVDLSHVSPATMSDALNASEAPVIFSHSSARALTDVRRNVPDSILARMPANRGVVMVTFVQPFVNGEAADWEDRLGDLRRNLLIRGASDAEIRQQSEKLRAAHPRPPGTIADIADHIEHVREVAGIDHVGIGSDFDGMTAPPEMPNVSAYPKLFAELIRRGWTDGDLGKLASGNILRVLRETETVAARLSAERPPSTAVITDYE